jgi:archaellum component FlaG (FlaF/FlaG flagellin family)
MKKNQIILLIFILFEIISSCSYIRNPENKESLKNILTQPIDNLFWLLKNNGKFETGNKESFYIKSIDRDQMTFDVSNNKVLVNMRYDGTLRCMNFYEPSVVNTTTIPGLYASSSMQIRSGELHYQLRIGDTLFDLSKVDWALKTGYLKGSIPVTYLEKDGLEIKLVAFAPISENGLETPRLGVYGIYLENQSAISKNGSIVFPKLKGENQEFPNSPSVILKYRNEGAEVSNNEISFNLLSGAHTWASTIVLANSNLIDYQSFETKSIDRWLFETMSFFDKMTGMLEMKDDPFTASYLKRSIILCSNAISTDANGDVACVRWGTTPYYGHGILNNGVQMKDCINTMIPGTWFNPELVKKSILWTYKYAIRVKDLKYEGGINHSLSMSLGSPILSGLYYKNSGDKQFFLDNSTMVDGVCDMLDSLSNSRETNDVWLFPSQFICDGYARGDYNTGANLCAWFAYKSFSRILDEVFGNSEKAKEYLEIANNIKRDLNKYCIIDSPMGKIYADGVNRDGSELEYKINGKCFNSRFYKDGEDSDLAFSPVFGFADYDDPVFHNSMKFALSDLNPVFCEETKGIYWRNSMTGEHRSVATFPSYINGLGSVTDRESMIGSKGKMIEIKKLTDLNGVNWWWPYKTLPTKYGEHLDRTPGHCGWFAGNMVSLLISEYIGANFDEPNKLLRFRPFSPSSSFKWEGVRFGNNTFNLAYEMSESKVTAEVENKNSFDVSVDVELILPHDKGEVIVNVGGKEDKIVYKKGTFFNSTTAMFRIELPAGLRVAIRYI